MPGITERERISQEGSRPIVQKGEYGLRTQALFRVCYLKVWPELRASGHPLLRLWLQRLAASPGLGWNTRDYV